MGVGEEVEIELEYHVIGFGYVFQISQLDMI
jgi:hypothetical protein